MNQRVYIDFDLAVRREGTGYTARASTPAGHEQHGFQMPFSELEVENFLLRLGVTRQGMRRVDSPETEAAKAFGSKLFDAIFDAELLALLRASLQAAEQQGAGLRLRLRLDEAPDIADIPWEFLYDRSLNRFLSLSAETPLVRYLEIPDSVKPLAVTAPLRVLVLIAAPSDLPPLDAEAEWNRLKNALAPLEQRGLVVLERLEEASLPALQRHLRQGEYHILHFIGHGGFNTSTQDGFLALEDEGGTSQLASGQELGTLLYDHRPLRLALLNACEGGRAVDSDPFAGVAQSLLQQGTPAVIAMQFAISDGAAITLSHEFYAALADGYPVDGALAEARRAVYFAGHGVEWGTPVLYMRAPDGKIFDVAAPAAPPAIFAPAAPTEVVPTTPDSATPRSLAPTPAPPATILTAPAVAEAAAPASSATAAVPQPQPLWRQRLRTIGMAGWIVLTLAGVFFCGLVSYALINPAAFPTATKATTAVPTTEAAVAPIIGATAEPTAAPAVAPTITAIAEPDKGVIAAPATLGGRIAFVAPDGLAIKSVRPDGSDEQELFRQEPSLVEGKTVNAISSLSAAPGGSYLLFGVRDGASGFTAYNLLRGGEVVSIGQFATPPRWSPDGRRLVATTAERKVEIYDVVARQSLLLDNLVADLASWYSDSNRLLLFDGTTHSMDEHQLDTGVVTELDTITPGTEDEANGPWVVSDIRLLPDDETVIFFGGQRNLIGGSGQGSRWWVIRPERFDAFAANDPSASYAYAVALSPDKERLAYVDYVPAGACGGIPSIIIVTAGTGEGVVRPPLPGQNPGAGRFGAVYGLSWSLDGSTIVYDLGLYNSCEQATFGTPQLYLWNPAQPNSQPRAIAKGILPVWLDAQ